MTDHSDLIARLRHADRHSQQRVWGSRIFDEAASALTSQSLSLSEAREKAEKFEQKWLEAVGFAARLDLETARLRGAISWALGEGDSDFGDNKPENAKPFWWRTELSRRAGKALENGPAGLADATSNPPLSDLSSLRKGAEEIEVTDEMIEAGKEAADGWTDRYMDGAEFVNWDEALPEIFRRMFALVSGSREDGA